MIFFTSDEHLDHSNVIKFCNRPFKDVEDMRESLIQRHNEVVRPGDLVYHLGDMFWRTCDENQAIEYVERLHGNHYYVNGNHEELMRKSPKLKSRFVWVKDIAKIHQSLDNPRIVLFHYAMLVWEGSHRGDWQLYGHSHGELSKAVPDRDVASKLNSLDVGVDCWNYYPISLEEVATVIRAKQTNDNLLQMIWHVCPYCSHKFSNFSQARAVCSKCDSLMTIPKDAVKETVKEAICA